MAIFEGDFSPPDGPVSAIVAARFNALVTEALLAGCRDGFVRHGVSDDRLDVAWVPGSFEIPARGADGWPDRGRYAAVVCLGLRGSSGGETGHHLRRPRRRARPPAGVLQAGNLATGTSR